jgi:hypothetical protein
MPQWQRRVRDTRLRVGENCGGGVSGGAVRWCGGEDVLSSGRIPILRMGLLRRLVVWYQLLRLYLPPS